jgi:hypothetical protein
MGTAALRPAPHPRSLLVRPLLAQLTDLEEECDGLTTYNREIKFSPADMANVVAANKAMIAAGSDPAALGGAVEARAAVF